MNLSKSLYTKGIQCQKSTLVKEVLTAPDDSALARFETGNGIDYWFVRDIKKPILFV